MFNTKKEEVIAAFLLLHLQLRCVRATTQLPLATTSHKRTTTCCPVLLVAKSPRFISDLLTVELKYTEMRLKKLECSAFGGYLMMETSWYSAASGITSHVSSYQTSNSTTKTFHGIVVSVNKRTICTKSIAYCMYMKWCVEQIALWPYISADQRQLFKSGNLTSQSHVSVQTDTPTSRQQITQSSLSCMLEHSKTNY